MIVLRILDLQQQRCTKRKLGVFAQKRIYDAFCSS